MFGMQPIFLLEVLVGIVILTLGRKLFWVFVGAVGFISGFVIATHFFYSQPDWIVLLISLATGVLGAVLAIFLQRFALWLAGFAAGGYLMISLLNILGWKMGQFSFLFFLIGGMIGFLLVATFFDWALIILSSLTGAAFVAQAFLFGPITTAFLFIVLFIAGMVIQASLLKK